MNKFLFNKVILSFLLVVCFIFIISPVYAYSGVEFDDGNSYDIPNFDYDNDSNIIIFKKANSDLFYIYMYPKNYTLKSYGKLGPSYYFYLYESPESEEIVTPNVIRYLCCQNGDIIHDSLECQIGLSWDIYERSAHYTNVDIYSVDNSMVFLQAPQTSITRVLVNQATTVGTSPMEQIKIILLIVVTIVIMILAFKKGWKILLGTFRQA